MYRQKDQKEKTTYLMIVLEKIYIFSCHQIKNAKIKKVKISKKVEALK